MLVTSALLSTRGGETHALILLVTLLKMGPQHLQSHVMGLLIIASSGLLKSGQHQWHNGHQRVAIRMVGSPKTLVALSTLPHTLNTAVTVEVGATIEAGVLFASVETSVSVSASLSQEWSRSNGKSETISFSCDNYDSGESFTGGCMWQMELKTVKNGKEELKWKPLIVKCTKSRNPPKCPPFTKCLDADCTKCGDRTRNSKDLVLSDGRDLNEEEEAIDEDKKKKKEDDEEKNKDDDQKGNDGQRETSKRRRD